LKLQTIWISVVPRHEVGHQGAPLERRRDAIGLQLRGGCRLRFRKASRAPPESNAHRDVPSNRKLRAAGRARCRPESQARFCPHEKFRNESSISELAFGAETVSDPISTIIVRESIAASDRAAPLQPSIVERPAASSRAAIAATSLAPAPCFTMRLEVPPADFFAIALNAPQVDAFFPSPRNDNMGRPVLEAPANITDS